MYSCGPPHMDVQKQDDQHEFTYSIYVRTQDVILKTCRRRWMIGRSCERGSGISMLAARHDDDDIGQEKQQQQRRHRLKSSVQTILTFWYLHLNTSILHSAYISNFRMIPNIHSIFLTSYLNWFIKNLLFTFCKILCAIYSIVNWIN